MQKRVPVLLLCACMGLSALLIACQAAQAESGFTDVPAGADYAGAVAWCHEQGLMQGTSETTFAPDQSLTRAMIATVLYRAAGKPEVGGTPSFADTQAGTWYSSAVVWANDSGIIQGYGNGLFGTNDPVTREQLDVLLGRYRGEEPAWTGDPALAVPATRAQVAVALYTTLTAAPAPELPTSEEPTVSGGKVLVVYFSATNNTKGIAEKIAAAADGELFAIEARIPYTSADLNYNDPASRSQVEQKDDTARPEITGTVSNPEDYSVVFLGYPIWNGKAPKVIYTFLESGGDWNGKTVVPFCTSGSGPIGSSAANLHPLISDEANWLEGKRFSANASQETVTSWVDGLGLELHKENKGEIPVTKINLTFNGYTYPATLADNSSARAFAELLQENGGALAIKMSDYGSFEKVGPLGTSLPRNDEQITTSAGDIILYQGNSITVYYAQNSWNFTRLGRLDDPSGLRDALGSGDVMITFSLQ